MVIRNIAGTVFVTMLLLLVFIIGLQYFWDEIRSVWFDEVPVSTIYIDNAPFSVRVADTLEERQQGLSGSEPLEPDQGMLFIFDRPDYYSFWMKDMSYPIDILWFNNERELIHIAEQVSPDSFPQQFAPDEPARFVVEVPAFSVTQLGITEGARLQLPAALLPIDVINDLQN